MNRGTLMDMLLNISRGALTAEPTIRLWLEQWLSRVASTSVKEGK